MKRDVKKRKKKIRNSKKLCGDVHAYSVFRRLPCTVRMLPVCVRVCMEYSCMTTEIIINMIIMMMFMMCAHRESSISVVTRLRCDNCFPWLKLVVAILLLFKIGIYPEEKEEEKLQKNKSHARVCSPFVSFCFDSVRFSVSSLSHYAIAFYQNTEPEHTHQNIIGDCLSSFGDACVLTRRKYMFSKSDSARASFDY